MLWSALGVLGWTRLEEWREGCEEAVKVAASAHRVVSCRRALEPAVADPQLSIPA